MRPSRLQFETNTVACVVTASSEGMLDRSATPSVFAVVISYVPLFVSSACHPKRIFTVSAIEIVAVVCVFSLLITGESARTRDSATAFVPCR